MGTRPATGNDRFLVLGMQGLLALLLLAAFYL